uniref:g6f-like isoform X2 n=1 Tax=Monopterus albus TaxID=43700 RepID=UPI0009B3E991|nr:uncharacterized protein LOC109966234 isoform X2 [Monopterus albus]
MESSFLTFIIVSSFAVYSSHCGTTDWADVVVAREGIPTSLVCNDTRVNGTVAINWMVKSFGADEWKLVLSANERKVFSGSAWKKSMHLTHPNFQDTGDFSLSFLPKLEDRGFYSCSIKQQERKLKERIILLAILTVTIVPAAPIPQYSTLRLIARVDPGIASEKITWATPGGTTMRSEIVANTGTVAKLPRLQNIDNGIYVCTVYPWGNSSSSFFTFPVDVIVDDNKVASIVSIKHDHMISTAIQAHASFLLTCPDVSGDYVLLYWKPPDTKRQNETKRVYQYDRWRTHSLPEQSKKLQLAGPPYNAEAGSFSFLLIPELKDGGVYICEVFLNENAFSQRTTLSVLKVTTRRSSSELTLTCLYTEVSQVRSADWEHQNKSHQLLVSYSTPGSITATVSLPITSETAGNYTCILMLINGKTIMITQDLALPSEEHVGVTTSSLLPSLSALLLLVPLVAGSVGVLLWRQKHISDRGIEQSLSVHSGEAENIYENPEDIRQAPPQGSVYMDLKPRGENDIYKELDRSQL